MLRTQAWTAWPLYERIYAYALAWGGADGFARVREALVVHVLCGFAGHVAWHGFTSPAQAARAVFASGDLSVPASPRNPRQERANGGEQ